MIHYSDAPTASPVWDSQTLFHEIMRARERVYHLASPTPLDRFRLDDGQEIFLKREDLSPIHSYKWRGAYNRMATLPSDQVQNGVVAASAGNHAQGVALSAQRLGIRATVYMPRSTPKMKIAEVERIGGAAVRIIIQGDHYDAAAQAAKLFAHEHNAPFIHPYDDPMTMAGQGSIGDEIVMASVNPEIAFIQIGGGGMAAAVACVLKTFYPSIHIIGVEGEGQASMARAVEAGTPIDLDNVDVFCDGTAVRRAGALTYGLCAELIDEFMTVNNNEVCAAIQRLWESARLISEPSGALGLAAVMKRQDQIRGRRTVAILSGANMDFVQLAWIARHSGVGLAERHYFQFEIAERSCALVDLLEECLAGINIVDFQYGKVDNDKAYPIIGFEASPMQMDVIDRRLTQLGVPHENVSNRVDVDFRIIHYRSRLFTHPYFVIIEFPERAGALMDFMRRVGDLCNICYFNYACTGEQIGRALMGFEFENDDDKGRFIERLNAQGPAYRELAPDVIKAIL